MTEGTGLTVGRDVIVEYTPEVCISVMEEKVGKNEVIKRLDDSPETSEELFVGKRKLAGTTVFVAL